MPSEQEKAWAGDFGDAYVARSPGNEESNYHFFVRAFEQVAMREFEGIRTALELGAGTGANLRALQRMQPGLETHAVEINPRAAETILKRHPPMHEIPRVKVCSVYDYEPQRAFDLVLTKGFLIHIPPERIVEVFDKIHRATARWILLAEYYNPKHVPITYRGERDLLWKGDFGGDMLERFKDLKLRDYGFVYHRDPNHPQDDVTWFLMEKTR